jgi:LPXTG-motif cell wall-anchored protein
MPYVNRVSGALLVLAGTYVAYYGVYELRQASGNLAEDPVVAAATSVQGALARFIDDLGPWILLAGLVLLLVVGLGIHGVRRRNRMKVRGIG